MRWRLLVGLVLAGMVLAFGANAGGGKDGPCLGPEFAQSAPEGSVVRGQTSGWPPGIRCTLTTPQGVVEQRTYPSWATWGLAALVGAAPLLARRRHWFRRRS